MILSSLCCRSVLPLELVFKVWEEFLATGSWSVLWAAGLSLLHLFEGKAPYPLSSPFLYIHSDYSPTLSSSLSLFPCR